MISAEEGSNFDIFRDCLSTSVIRKLAPQDGKKKRNVKGRKNEIKPVVRAEQSESDAVNDAAELADFVEVGRSAPSTPRKWTTVLRLNLLVPR